VEGNGRGVYYIVSNDTISHLPGETEENHE
jgi:hypothetical protein